MNSKNSNGISDSSNSSPIQPNDPFASVSEEKRIEKAYPAKNAPTFKQWLNIFFPGQVTNIMVSKFEEAMCKMIQTEIRREMKRHKEIQQQIKQRINEG